MLQKKKEVIFLTKNNYHAVLLQKETGKVFPYIQYFMISEYQQAVDILQSKKIQGILFDADLEEDVDYSALQEVMRAAPFVPVVVLSSDKSVIVAKRFFTLGIDELIIKDESFHVIVPKILNHVIRKQKSKNEILMRQQQRGDSLNLGVLKATVATLLHEINNPLMTILGMTELILDEAKNPEAELFKKVKIIAKSAHRIKKSTNQLANLSNPVYKKTLGGNLIDLKKSRISPEKTANLVEK